jgi:hypothetical protein
MRSAFIPIRLLSACLVCFWTSTPSPALDEKVILQASGRGHQHLDPFSVESQWEVRWEFKGEFDNNLFQMAIHAKSPDLPIAEVTQKGPGKGMRHLNKGGTYYLRVFGMGEWIITVVQLR